MAMKGSLFSPMQAARSQDVKKQNKTTAPLLPHPKNETMSKIQPFIDKTFTLNNITCTVYIANLNYID